MSIDDTTVAETATTDEAPAFSVNRRTLMKTAAGAGVAAAAVGIVGVAHASGTPRQATAAAGIAGGAPLSGPAGAASAAAAPLVVHVSDLANGTLEIFTNGTRTQVTDVDLARRIATAAN
jgi:purine-cytosine permease-like protein